MWQYAQNEVSLGFCGDTPAVLPCCQSAIGKPEPLIEGVGMSCCVASSVHYRNHRAAYPMGVMPTETACVRIGDEGEDTKTPSSDGVLHLSLAPAV